MKNDRFLIITGLAGSGKTIASQFLEDLGYYCMDNLPTKLIDSFVKLWQRKEVEIEKVALVVDVREPGFSKAFPKALKSIREKITPYVIFLETSDDVLIKRYSESRRPHPLVRGKSVMEAVALERERLKEIKNLADEVIDTSSMSISDLRNILTRKFSARSSKRLQIKVVSFGYKYGIPLDSDLVFDTRFLPNPFYIDILREKTGRTKAVKEFVLGNPETKKFLGLLFRLVDFLMPRFIDEGKTYLTISIGCTGGKHRSVALAERMRDYLKEKKYAAQVNHRDIYK
jgi:UPF0042 nucleotide-binding protein